MRKNTLFHIFTRRLIDIAYKLFSHHRGLHRNIFVKASYYIIVSFKIESNKEVRAGSQVLNVDVF